VYVATLLCETLMSPKQAINSKLQGSVATYLRCGDGDIVNNQIKKGLLLSPWVKFFLIGEYLANLQARTWLPCALSLCLAVRWSGAQSAQDNHVLACNVAKYSLILFFSLTDLAINLT